VVAVSLDFTTRDPSVAIQRFSREARRGNGLWRRGLIAMMCLPITFFAIGSLPTALLLSMVQLGLSAVWIVKGLVRADIANRKLEAAKQLVQLPAARLVER
jgi:hypothetical protein